MFLFCFHWKPIKMTDFHCNGSTAWHSVKECCLSRNSKFIYSSSYQNTLIYYRITRHSNCKLANKYLNHATIFIPPLLLWSIHSTVRHSRIKVTCCNTGLIWAFFLIMQMIIRGTHLCCFVVNLYVSLFIEQFKATWQI